VRGTRVEARQFEAGAEARRAEKYQEMVTEAGTLAEKACKNYNAQRRELEELSSVLKRVDGKAAKEEGGGGGGGESAEAAAARAALATCEEHLAVVGEARPATGSAFLRLFLGKVNMKLPLHRDRQLFKDEYNQFKEAMNYGFIVFPLLWALMAYSLVYRLRYVHWIINVTQVWLLYYYVSLALRENILKVNGSQIRRWWIRHHYVSSGMSILMLAWPDSDLQREFIPYFTAYFLAQGIVQFVQGWYQKRRHYARRALGKASSMDPATTEGIQEVDSGLYFIVPLLVAMYMIQFSLGALLLHAAVHRLNLLQPIWNYKEEIQVTALGLCFCFLAIMNLTVLVKTLMSKSSGPKAKDD
jgi:TMPIT-like protein